MIKIKNLLFCLFTSCVISEMSAMAQALAKPKIAQSIKSLGTTLVKHKYKTGAGAALLCAALATRNYYKPENVRKRQWNKIQQQVKKLDAERTATFTRLRGQKSLWGTLVVYSDDRALAGSAGARIFAEQLNSLGVTRDISAEEFLAGKYKFDDLRVVRIVIDFVNNHAAFAKNRGLDPALLWRLGLYVDQLDHRLKLIKGTLEKVSIKDMQDTTSDLFVDYTKHGEFTGKIRQIELMLMSASENFLMQATVDLGLNDNTPRFRELVQKIHNIKDMDSLGTAYSLLSGYSPQKSR